jgi:uncharacterized membrane protein
MALSIPSPESRRAPGHGTSAAPPRLTLNAAFAAGVTGFALGGFFDGILLHQVLQWHHFLSLVPGEALRDLRVQVLADGWFHVAVYVLALLGLFLLWRVRRDLAAQGMRRPVLAAVLLGFVAWQVTDVVLFHWVIGIHRIRVDVPAPLLWDLGWLAVVGGVPLVAALLLRRNGSGNTGGGSGRGVAAAITAILLVAAPVAAIPSIGTAPVLVVFRHGMELEGMIAAAAAADGRVVWADPDVGLATVSLPDGGGWRLLTRGALLVGGVGPAGCLGWSRT